MINIDNFSQILIVICIVLFLALTFKKQVGFIFQFLIRAIFGSVFFSVINAMAGTVVGVNLLSIITVGFLGMPGVVLLYATNFFI